MPENSNSLHPLGLPARWEDGRQAVMCSLVLTLCRTVCVWVKPRYKIRNKDPGSLTLKTAHAAGMQSAGSGNWRTAERTCGAEGRSTRNIAVPTRSHAHTYMVWSYTTLVCLKHFRHLRVWEGKTE